MPKPICFMIMPYGRKATQAEPSVGVAEIDFNALWDRALPADSADVFTSNFSSPGSEAKARARAGDVVLLDHPADTTRVSRRGARFHCAGAGWRKRQKNDLAKIAMSKKFKLDPQRLLYSLQWKHDATPADLHLQLVRDPQLWFDLWVGPASETESRPPAAALYPPTGGNSEGA